MTTTPHPLVIELRRIRTERGMSMGQLALRLGYDRAAISYWESGKRYPSIAVLEDWTSALGYRLALQPADVPAGHACPAPEAVAS